MDSTDTDQLRASFDGGRPTVGIEEELMLLDPETLDLAPRASEVLEGLAGDPRFKGELPAAQVELISDPCATVGDAAVQVAAARSALAAAATPLLPAGGGAHPFAATEGRLSDDPRYAFTRDEYGPVASRQLVFGLHVHVKVGGPGRTLAVYNALRSHLPELAALAANAPFHAGEDTGFASIRPQLSTLLPRQGVPPVLGDIDEFAEALRFGREAGTCPSRACGGGSCARTRCSARWSCEFRTSRPLSGTPRPWQRSVMRSRWRWRSATTRGRRCPSTRRGRSPRTAGRRPATAWPARWPTSTPESRRRRGGGCWT